MIEIMHYSELNQWAGSTKGYLFYENMDGRKYVIHTEKELPPGLLGDSQLKFLGLTEEWDWGLFPKVGNILKRVTNFSKNSNKNRSVDHMRTKSGEKERLRSILFPLYNYPRHIE